MPSPKGQLTQRSSQGAPFYFYHDRKAKIMKPPMSYYGGKQRIASKIIPLIPQHTVYAEPFCGAATVLFKKPWPDVTNGQSYREIINDNDQHLINFFEQLKHNGEELVRRLELTLYSEHYYQASLREGLNCEDKLEAACRYFINTNMSFSNRMDGGWGRNVFGANLAMSWMNKVDRLGEYIDRMRSVYIASVDAVKFIEQWDSPQTFFYCDPPYPTTKFHYANEYAKEDFTRLIDALDNCQGSFLLSCYDFEGIKVPDEWERFTFESVNSSSGTGKVKVDRSLHVSERDLGDRKRTEVVYRRFNKVEPRKEIKKLYESGQFDCFVPKPLKNE